MIKYPDKNKCKEIKVIFGSQFQGLAHCDREGTEPGAWGSWSHYIGSQEAGGGAYCWSVGYVVQHPSPLNSTTHIKDGFVYFINLILKIL